jgi:hypothetical protein
MIELTGSPFHCCDGIRRRDFLRIGSLGLGALSLPQIMAWRAQAGVVSKPTTSVIYIELAGGPTQFETYDPKPEAPTEFRGPARAISTNVAGIQFSEFMAEQAKIMDKLAIIRSIHHERSSHDPSSHLTQTGYYKEGRKGGVNEMPSVGSVASQLRGPNQIGLPAYVAVPSRMRNGGAAYLGNANAPFVTGGNPNQNRFAVRNLSLSGRMNVGRLQQRRDLLTTLDAHRRYVDTQGDVDAIDHFTREAFDLVTGDLARKAFDISAEDSKTRETYGRSTVGQSLLLARRLVESGVTFVSVRAGGWDDHNQIEKRMKAKGPAYDQGVAALVNDLYQRGLDGDVLVVAMGEFGRTPRVNRNAGRDHWGALMSVLLAGGGLRTGQVVGRSNSKGETPEDRPYRPESVLAMIYRHMKIDPGQTFPDFSGRPRYLLERRELISELL